MASEGDGDGDDTFMLYDPGVITRLRDRDFFRQAIPQFYVLVANSYGWSVSLSDRRIGEAHDFWLADVARTLDHGTDDETTELDHFKHASFIAYWLRRLIPINDIFYPTGTPEGTSPSPEQVRFSRYGNEICALLTGFTICLAYETYARAEREADATVSTISETVGIKALPEHLESEFPKLLKHKNVSPQALYMLYRSLFDALDWDVKLRERGVA